MGRLITDHVGKRYGKGDAGDYEPGNVEWKPQRDNLREMHVARGHELRVLA